MKEQMDIEEIKFEIQFYEGIVAKDPSFIGALAALGDLYTKAGEYQKGLDVDEQLEQLKPEDPIVLYNLACSYSLLKELDKALRFIKKAVKCGYHDFKHMENDEDLVNLRKDSRFKRYFEKLKCKGE